jgi:hypothetical protein
MGARQAPSPRSHYFLLIESFVAFQALIRVIGSGLPVKTCQGSTVGALSAGCGDGGGQTHQQRPALTGGCAGIPVPCRPMCALFNNRKVYILDLVDEKRRKHDFIAFAVW